MGRCTVTRNTIQFTATDPSDGVVCCPISPSHQLSADAQVGWYYCYQCGKSYYEKSRSVLVYEVTYFDSIRSRASKHSIMVQSFANRSDADAFADKHTLYGRRAKVEEVSK